jgi:hypothetical protein
MKIFKALVLIAIVGSMIFSCTKDKIVPTAAQTNAIVLAGAVGSSKTWKMTTASFSQNGGTAQSIPLGSCVQDNVFKFTNNTTQDFIQNEGATKCNSADSTITEQGNWAFTNDGKSLVVEGVWFDDLNAESEFVFTLTTVGEEVNVLTLTDTLLVVAYSFPYQGGTVTLTVSFSKIS